jgi:acyl-CoA synthetase (AMP-forming)/AMP-acid ligase II
LIEGSIVAREYFKDAKKKTAAAFIQEAPWLPQTGEPRSKPRRIFKSGDLVRYNSNGTVSFIGRKDNQVKIRGQRVELGEIEYQIQKSIPGIDRVVPYVSKPSDQGGRFTLIAFLVFKGKFETSGEDPDGCQTLDTATLVELKALKSALVASLPSYMVPSLYVPLRRILLTLNGKNDARKLRSIFQSLSAEQLKLMSLVQDVKIDSVKLPQQEHLPPRENEPTSSEKNKTIRNKIWKQSPGRVNANVDYLGSIARQPYSGHQINCS